MPKPKRPQKCNVCGNYARSNYWRVGKCWCIDCDRQDEIYKPEPVLHRNSSLSMWLTEW
jgi:hypothetical protein